MDIDECATNKHDCHASAECINTTDGYQCKCQTGFEGDGTSESPCIEIQSSPTWSVGKWTMCTVSCNGGVRRR